MFATNWIIMKAESDLGSKLIRSIVKVKVGSLELNELQRSNKYQ